jgi:ribA/ribD-fused uncharacterized protein
MRTTDKYVFFWSGIYSQWHFADMYVKVVENYMEIFAIEQFNCCEQYMMYKKATLFYDYDAALEIMKAKRPVDQKSLGSTVKNFNQIEWNENKERIVYEGNMYKFAQHPEIAKELIATGDRIIVEASPSDTIWGIGLHYDNKDVEDETKWKGLNLLGKALMRVRTDIQNLELVKRYK